MRRQIRSIFCATDFSEFAGVVVAYGIAMAKRFEATLYICHVVDLPTVSAYGEAVFDPIEYQQRFMDTALREIHSLLEDSGVRYEPLVTIGSTTEEITRLAKDYTAELVITATHGRSGLKRFFLGSVTERLMRTLPCPLLVLRGSEELTDHMDSPRVPFKKILVGCDFSEDANAALNYSLSLAQEFESELHLVHVVEPSGYKDLFRIQQESGEQIRQDLYQMIRDRLNSLVPGEALNWITLESRVLAGKPYAELIRYADIHDMDMIALGIRGHGMVEELLVGSTTDRVIRQAPCPVLSICPD
ncbi:MAG TPA: universal stress protein [Desulfosalsimonadaceae bacterium]|nr:universal stress protein [Desulfosalsimonadaceae bacterium]